jgi:hypothetical protein
MPRTIIVLLALIACPCALHAEEAAQGGWQVTVTAQARPPLGRIKKLQCPFGIGACGGKCGEDGRKQWDCAEGELPCYQESHCSCELADMCKPTTAPARQTPQASHTPDNAQLHRFLSRLGL